MLTAWAHRHRIPPAAMADLLALMGVAEPPPAGGTLHSEAGVQQAVRLAAARRGARLWRNNVGVSQDDAGRVIRYGLANSSAGENRAIKSSDLIGITPVVCPCGHRYGLFTAYECKRPGWHLTPGDARGQAQLAFLQLVLSFGGIGKFVTDPENF
jgi:hypothetical protein